MTAFQRFYGHNNFQVANISRRTRIFSYGLIALSMLAISANFYQADAVFLQSSVLPFYILFFILMYVVCITIEYVSLWCERGKSFHTASVGVHALVLMLVAIETGGFYSANKDVYSHFPSWSVSGAISHIIKPHSVLDDPRVQSHLLKAREQHFAGVSEGLFAR